MRRAHPTVNYLKLWTASTASNLGDGITLVALPLLAAAVTRDPLLVSLVGLCQGLPWLLTSLHAGAIADRVDRRRLMVNVDLGRMAVSLILGLAAFEGWVNVPLLCVCAFLLGVGETLFDNASQPMVPAVAGSMNLEDANARLFAGQVVTNGFVGQPVGGFLFAASAGLPFVADAGTFLVSVLLLLSIRGSFRPDRPEDRPATSLTADVKEGIRWLWGHKLIRNLAGLLAVGNFVYGLTSGVFVLLALEVLGLNEQAFGILLISGSVGSLIGSALASRLSALLGPGTTLATMIALSGVAAGGLAVSSDPLSAGVMLALEGVVVTVWNVVTIALRQEIIPDGIMGRVTGAYRLVGVGAGPLGIIVGGVVASWFGLRAPYVLGFAVAALTVPIALRVASNRRIAAAREASAEA